MSKEIQILEAVPQLETAPIYYCSTHGSYEFSSELKSATEFTVPEDTIIIETTPIGYYCYFTNVLQAILPLLTDRPKLLQYLDGQPVKNDGKLRRKIIGALSTFIIYLPGSRIVNRELTIGAGRTPGLNPEKMESQRLHYKDMRFTRFLPGGKPEGDELLKSTRAYLMEKPMVNFETYETILGKLYEDPKGLAKGQPRIVIFPSCGSIFTPEKYPKEIRRVEELQQAARLKWMSLQSKTFNAVMKNYTTEPTERLTQNEKGGIFAGERLRDPEGRKEFNMPQPGMNNIEFPEKLGPVTRSEMRKMDLDPVGNTIPAMKTMATGTKQVFQAQTTTGRAGGYVNYKFIGNLTKAEINARLQAGEVLYEYVDGEPTQLTFMSGGLRLRETRKRRTPRSKKTRRYSMLK